MEITYLQLAWRRKTKQMEQTQIFKEVMMWKMKNMSFKLVRATPINKKTAPILNQKGIHIDCTPLLMIELSKALTNRWTRRRYVDQ